jgi:L-lactate dehydrogenase complex protein LldG
MTRVTRPEIMENSRKEFIRTIQQALGKSSSPVSSDLFEAPTADLDAQLNSYLNKTRSEQEALLDLFIEQAELVHVKVTTVETSLEAGSAIRELVHSTEPEWGDKKQVIAWQHPLVEQLDLEGSLKKDGIDLFITKGSDKPDSAERDDIRRELIRSYIGITAADFCVAQSATLVMRTRSGQPRAVSIVPSIHVAVITIDQILESLEELYFRFKWDRKEKELGLTNCMTFISGPSKTADIELQMVFGAHGPRQLYVYVIVN